MNVQVIIWLIVGVVFGGLLSFIICLIFLKKGHRKEGSSGEVKLDETKADVVRMNAERELEAQKTRYENLLSEARAQCDELDTQLKAALEGNTDFASQSQLDLLEKNKIKIRELEDELEETEDDLSDAKKKLGKREEEISNLQDSLDAEKKASKNLQADLQKTRQELERTITDLNSKVVALVFLQEILSAKDTNSKDSTEIIKNVDKFESFVKGPYFDVNSFLYNAGYLAWSGVAGQQGFDKKKQVITSLFEQWASTKKKNWLYNKTTVAFVGEFSAGKTSIVNRILSQDNPDIPRLPVSVEATTAIPTYIAGGLKETYSFITGDGKRKTILGSTFKKVSKQLFDQIKGVSSLIKYFVMEYNNPNLRGLSILDTPGFNSNDKEDGMRTIEVINECDALFWVIDVNIGELNRSSLPIIKERLHKPLYIVLNKVDTKAESDIKMVEDKIKSTLDREGVKVERYVRFSTKTPLNVIMEPIQQVTKISARDTFVIDLEKDIENVLDILNGLVKKKSSEYQLRYQEGESINEQFDASIRSLQYNCSTAATIPQFKEGFKVLGIGSDDKFVMSIAQTNQLKNILSNISGANVQALSTIYGNRTDKAHEIQQAWSELCELKNAWQKMNECMQQFKRIKNSVS